MLAHGLSQVGQHFGIAFHGDEVRTGFVEPELDHPEPVQAQCEREQREREHDASAIQAAFFPVMRIVHSLPTMLTGARRARITSVPPSGYKSSSIWYVPAAASSGTSSP